MDASSNLPNRSIHCTPRRRQAVEGPAREVGHSCLERADASARGPGLLRQRIPANRPFQPHPIPWIVVNIVPLAAPRCFSLPILARSGSGPTPRHGPCRPVARSLAQEEGPKSSVLSQRPTNPRTPLSGRWTFFVGAPQDLQVVDNFLPQ